MVLNGVRLAKTERKPITMIFTPTEIAEIVGATGIILSLIYAAWQLRLNARDTRTAIFVEVTASFAEHWHELSMNAEMVDLMIRGTDDFDGLDRVEKARMRFFVMSYARRYENAWFAHRVGILNKNDWKGIDGDIHVVASLPGWVTAWQLVKNRCSPEFQDFVDKAIAEEAAKRA